MASQKLWKAARVAAISGAAGALVPIVLFLLFKWDLLRSVPYPLFFIVCPPLILTLRDWDPTGLQILEQLVEVALLNAGIYAAIGAIVSALSMDA
jgi:hypothetical protein